MKNTLKLISAEMLKKKIKILTSLSWPSLKL